MPLPNLRTGHKKPVDKQKLLNKLRSDPELMAFAREENLLPTQAQEEASKFVTVDEYMKHQLKTAILLSEKDEPVLITGESGTGKELFANILHAERSKGGSKPTSGNFIPINCAAVSDTLMDAELFGYVKGSFTGADTDRHGLFESAQNGTIFLDEIADAPPQLQAKLLRVLETNTVRRVGGTKEIYINFRVVAATHKDLPALVKQNLFREDLFWRLFGYNIRITPLRERRDDIIEILDTLYNGVTQDFIDKIILTPLTGNVRELKAQWRYWEYNKQLFNIDI